MRFWISGAALAFLFGCDDGYPSSVRGSNAGESLEAQSATASVDPALEFRRSCAGEVAALPIDRDLPSAAGGFELEVPSHAQGMGDCGDFAWVRGFVSVGALIDPEWAGPSRTSSPWDCNHTSIEYGVYRNVQGAWEYVDGGLAFGGLASDGTCTHSVENFPSASGSDKVLVFATDSDSDRTEVRVGVRAWSHNDPTMGHPGDECSTASCYWPVRIVWNAY